VVVGPGDCPDLGALCEHIGDCHRCALGSSRTQVVFGSGDPHSGVMFVGEAPGRNEDLEGVPFVGAAGHLLDELLESIGLERTQVYIANVVKCRPAGNRDALPDEIATCTPFLRRQIELIDPRVIATLGRFAAHWLLDTTAPISALRGKLYRVGEMRVVPIFHPAAALYDASKREVLLDDFKRLKAVCDEHPGPVGATPSAGLASPVSSPEGRPDAHGPLFAQDAPGTSEEGPSDHGGQGALF
jgi:uracil-DNA glycosylase family 4